MVAVGSLRMRWMVAVGGLQTKQMVAASVDF
jgi:hypothetical protein